MREILQNNNRGRAVHDFRSAALVDERTFAERLTRKGPKAVGSLTYRKKVVRA